MKIYLFVLFNLFYSVVYSQTQQDVLISEQGSHPKVGVDDPGKMYIIWSDSNTSVKLTNLDSVGNFLLDKIALYERNGFGGTCLSIFDTLIITAWGSPPSPYNQNILGQLVTTSGDLVGNNVVFNDDYGEENRDNPFISWLNDSLFIAVWTGYGIQTPDSYSVYGQFASASNSPIGSDFLITDHGFANIDHYNAHVVAAVDNNKFLVIWSDNYLDDYKVWGRYFNYNGLPLNDSFLISDSLSSHRALEFDCAKDNQGNIVIVWGEGDLSQDGFIKWRWIDPQGNFWGESEIISPENSVVTFGVTVGVSIDLNGDIILIYEDLRSGKSEIYGQRFNPDRTKLGSEFQISSRTTDFAQVFPNVALQSGKIYTVWSEVGNTFEGVWARIIDFYYPPVSVEDETEVFPNESKLLQNYPNPFNPSTTIKYQLSNSGIITLKVYDILGREITNLVNEFKSKGSYEKNFNTNNLSSGVYIYRITVTDNGRILFTDSKHMILLR